MKKLTLVLGLFLASISATFAQAPANAPDVMLQGFHWDSYGGGEMDKSYGRTKWSDLATQVDEISESFDLVWLPPSARSSGGTGYHPKEWCKQNSEWGGASVLKNLITAFKNKGTRCVADIVINHRDGNYNWDDFCNEDFGTYGKFTLYPSAQFICKDDDCTVIGKSATGANDAGYETLKCEVWENGVKKGEKSANGAYCASRDLDHSNKTVQDAIKAYLKWMKNEMGYDGWRYDLVKGYLGKYNGMYNDAAGAYMSVGEYWDGDYGRVKNWVSDTGYKSMAFDFPMKYAALNNSLAGNNYQGMASGYGVPQGLCGADEMKRYAVTFVDNHDTFRDHNKFGGDWTKANAYILSAPGIPCVFYPHWEKCKNDIKAMIKARKKVGIHSQSACTTEGTCGSYYKCTTTGSNGKLICFIGSGWSDPAGYTKACSGNGWAFYTQGGVDGPTVTMNPASGYVGANGKVTLTATKGTIYYTTNGTTPSASSTKYTDPITITTNNTTIKAIAIDGTTKSSVVSGTFLTEKPAGLTVEFKAPAGWTTVNLYAWAEGEPDLLGKWPGKAISKSGDYYTYTITETDTRPLNIIFNDGTNQTADITGISTNSCYDGTNPSGKDAKENIIPGNCSGTPIPPVPPVPGDKITLKVKASSLPWGNTCYVHAWNGGELEGVANVNYTGEWPGQAMTLGSDGYYSITFDQNMVYALFNNGVASDGEQTDDIQHITASTCYEISSDTHLNMMQNEVYTANETTCPTTDIDDVYAANVSIYPNPTSDKATVVADQEVYSVAIQNLSGWTVAMSYNEEIDLSNLAPAMYLATIKFNDGNTVVKKIIKK